MSTPTEIARDYIALWNETDAGTRRALLTTTWTESATYADPMMTGAGHAEINALIAGVHERFPDFLFSLHGNPDGYDEIVRFSWTLGPAGGEPVAKGTDGVRGQGGRSASGTGCRDRMP